MDTAISDGDFSSGSNGLPRQIYGVEELLQRALIRLSIPRGMFRYDTTLGSGLHELKAEDDDVRALALAQEALKPLQQLTVERAVYQKTDPKRVEVLVCWKGGKRTLEVKL